MRNCLFGFITHTHQSVVFFNRQHFLCDGVSNCPNGEDEDELHCFKCSDGNSIPKAWICDGHRDCVEGKDEDGCENEHHWEPLIPV